MPTIKALSYKIEIKGYVEHDERISLNKGKIDSLYTYSKYFSMYSYLFYINIPHAGSLG